MYLQRLSINGIRNLQSVDLSGLGAVNVFDGLNGSGKTSVLESIHLLGVARSFRSAKIETVINYQADAAVVFGEIRGGEDTAEAVHRVGVKRERGQRAQVKVDGETVRSLADLAGMLPLQLINADSFQLLEGSPALRRQLLDWMVFHVKHHAFYSVWQRYRRALKQRNSLLRAGNARRADLAPWDREIASCGEELHRFRGEQFQVFKGHFHAVYGSLLKSIGEPTADAVDIVYHPGWNVEAQDLESLLADTLPRDQQLGYTRQGPHRADIRIRVHGKPAAELMSRGQLKSIVCSIRIAQAMLLLEYGINSVFLIDDLPAELDARRREWVVKTLRDLGLQLFVTAIDATELEHCWSSTPALATDQIKRFHVEHGRITPG